MGRSLRYQRSDFAGAWPSPAASGSSVAASLAAARLYQQGFSQLFGMKARDPQFQPEGEKQIDEECQQQPGADAGPEVSLLLVLADVELLFQLLTCCTRSTWA